MFNNIYKGKKIFITGHTGFKGSWLTLWLTELGAEIKGYSLPPRTPRDHFLTAGIDKICTTIFGDVRDYISLRSEIAVFRPDIVFHLAAQPLVRQSYLNPRETYEVNMMGTVNILEAVRGCDTVRSVINVTSDKCYQNREQAAPYNEDDPMGGHDPYSSSKGCSELITAAYRNSFFMPDSPKNKFIASGRAGNVIGGGDWSPERIMTDIIESLIQEKPVNVRNPHAVRPWQHVLEPLSGYLLLGSIGFSSGCDRFARGWNFGPRADSPVTVKELTETAIHVFGSGSWIDTSDPHAPHEAKMLTLDITRAENELEWLPVLSFSETIEMTVSWYTHYAKTQEMMRGFSLSQIRDYTEKASAAHVKWAAC